MAAQYSFVMKNMTKTFPGAQKPVLSNINLQFYQDAKIGIVGPNGMGLAAHIDGVDLLLGSFGKTVGSYASYIACSKALINYFAYANPTLNKLTPLPPLYPHF